MKIKECIKKLKKPSYFTIGALLFLVLATIMVWNSIENNNQSISSTPAKVQFEGRYKIGDGEWSTIKEGKHIPSTQGVVTLEGYFQFYNPQTGAPNGRNYTGTKIVSYLNHINAVLQTSDGEKIEFDCENKNIGEPSCGEIKLFYEISGNEDTIITIKLTNPHLFGNANAVDEFLQNVSIDYGIKYEKEKNKEGAFNRLLGFLFVIFSLIIFGVAVLFTLLHIPYKRQTFLVAFMIMFGGLHCLFSAKFIYYWSSYVFFNTIALEISTMFFMIFATAITCEVLSEKMRLGGTISCGLSILSAVICLSISLLSNVYFYDTWLAYMAMQSVSAIIVIFCFVFDMKNSNRSQKIAKLSAIIFLTSFLIDFMVTAIGLWQGAVLTKIAFCIIFIVALVSVLKVIPENLNASMRAKELASERQALKLELQKSRISLMLSQIKPHFIYNTLGTIGEFCESKPQQARQLVQDFSLYLRGNFGELDNMSPIPVKQEIEHVKHYVKIENVRFPDMVITFDLQSDDFFIPALSIQPLVENAIKHGLLKLEKGGAVTVKTYETQDAYCISVTDNGVGFDTSAPMDEKKHIGIRNIRDRLNLMCDGTLTIESTVGVGTKAVITIPKEIIDESNNG